ncbi:hypothetical protein ACKLNR_004094 [Fusarium oxysporum f. sp. zingiberi]
MDNSDQRKDLDPSPQENTSSKHELQVKHCPYHHFFTITWPLFSAAISFQVLFMSLIASSTSPSIACAIFKARVDS